MTAALHPITRKKMTPKQSALFELALVGELVRIKIGVTPINGVTCGKRHFPRRTFNELAALFGRPEIEFSELHERVAVYRLSPEYAEAT